MKEWRRLGAMALLLFIPLMLLACTSGQSSSRLNKNSGPEGPAANALWGLLSQCINASGNQTCACPSLLGSCCAGPASSYADAVWATTPDFVALRDVKQCACPSEFVHGLALPRVKVTGIEDLNRPNAIWPFAWQTAATKIANPQEICLAINPPQARSQNQMHVHMMRLLPKTRTWLDGAQHLEGLVLLDLTDLHGVFTEVLVKVGADQMGKTGVVVAQGVHGRYRALLTDRTAAEHFCQKLCD